MNLWFPLHKTRFYGEYTRWQLGPYSSNGDLLDRGEWNYIVISNNEDGLINGTSGRKPDDDFMDRQRSFKSVVLTAAYESGELIRTISSQGFSEIQIYKNRRHIKTSE